MTSSSGCPEVVNNQSVDAGCFFYFRDELDIRKQIWHSNAKPWTPGLPWNGTVTGTNKWHPGESTPPSDATMLAGFRAALEDPRMSELRGWLNHRFDPTHYQMPLPLEQTWGICENNLQPSTCLNILRGDPVNTATGALVEQYTDLSLPGVGVPFELTRTYQSNLPATDASVNSPLGPKWRHAYQTEVAEDGDGNVTVTATDGQQAVFFEDSGDYITPPGIRSTLTLDSGVFHLRTAEGSETLYSRSTGKPTAMIDRFGNGLSFGYSAGALHTITDQAGRVATFTYDEVPAGALERTRLVSVELTDGRSIEYHYADTLVAPLVGVTDVLDGETGYVYAAPGSADLRLSQIQDANEVVVATNTYDDSGRVISQEDAEGGVTSFDYADDGSVTTTRPNGAVERDRYNGNVIMSQTDGEG
ncbi:MAG TPA: DUF6531 domain-containing protein, partial [Miltoncostaeaceae bacterium]|nr:DUF6531 domain-containing protein [Miltoncostaeaceae bacterium]